MSPPRGRRHAAPTSRAQPPARPGVGEVDVDSEFLALVDPDKAAGHAFERSEPTLYRLWIQAHRLADANRGKGVVGVEVPNEVERQLVCPARRLDLQPQSRAVVARG